MARPRIVASPEEFDQRADEYFKECEERSLPPSVVGLALALGFVHRQSLTDYEKREGFSDSVKRARSRVEAAYESGLWGKSPAGAIFALKNMGWSDRQEVALSGGVTVAAGALDEAL